MRAFCYVMPRSSMLLACKTDHALYRPFEPVTCRIKVRDHLDRPVQANLSVSIRNGVESDFREYDHSIYTDLLLVSDLKGYIHQPGFILRTSLPNVSKCWMSSYWYVAGGSMTFPD